MASDGVPSNNTLTRTYAIKAVKPMPFTEDFNNATWRSDVGLYYIGSSAGIILSTSYTHGTAPDTSLYFSFTPYPREAWIVMPPVNLAGATSPLLTFWESSQYWGDDTLEQHIVLVRTGMFGWDSYDTLVVYDSSATLPTVPEWQQQTLDLSAYVGDTVWVAFQFHAVDNGGNWYLDDIQLSNGSGLTHDVAASAIIEPVSPVTQSVPFTPRTVVSNLGLSSENVDVFFNIYDASSLIHADTVSALALDSAMVDTAIFDSYSIATAGAYTCTTSVVIGSDENLANNKRGMALTVQSGSACDYLIGDINGDGSRVGGDVTYGVRYFKGVGTPPRDSCFMDSTSAYLYVAGDCNGNCEFRGSDITRLVAFFKGTAHLSCCHWFPTTLPPIILRTQTPDQIKNSGTARSTE